MSPQCLLTTDCPISTEQHGGIYIGCQAVLNDLDVGWQEDRIRPDASATQQSCLNTRKSVESTVYLRSLIVCSPCIPLIILPGRPPFPLLGLYTMAA